MARIAAVDVGTNSVLLLVVEQSRDGVEVLTDRATITRLGEDVDRTRRLSRAASERTLACLREFADVVRLLAVERVDVVGTSVLRDARGTDDFRAEVAGLFGTELLVLSGDREAELTYRGALTGLGLTGMVVVADIGGGSTEVIQGVVDPEGARIDEQTSLNLGSVRLHERHVQHDPPAPAEIAAIREEVRGALEHVRTPNSSFSLVAVAGTATTLATVALGIERYDSLLVHGARLSASAIHATATRLGELPLEERRKTPGLEPARADVIVAGAWVLSELLDWAAMSEVIISDRGVRWGLISVQGG